MQTIAFSIPSLAESDSHSLEVQQIRGALATCLARLKSVDKRMSLRRTGPTEVEFQLYNVFEPNSDLEENARAVRPLLDCLTEIDMAYLRAHPGTQWLYDHPLRYDRTMIWDSTPALYKRGHGDCKSLACARVAEYRLAGQQARADFRFMPPNMSSTRHFQYHILVLGPYGWEDPSKIKGMGQNENSYF